jgi:hypothetical protein
VEKELPEGLIDKFLSWDGYLGVHSRVSREAYRIYQLRKEKKIPGTAETDWHDAEENVIIQFVDKETGPPQT